MTPEEFKQRYDSLVEHYSELNLEQSPINLYDNWLWFQSSALNLLYEYNNDDDVQSR